MKVVSRMEYIRNTAYTLPYWENIRNADINKLSEIAGDGINEKRLVVK